MSYYQRKKHNGVLRPIFMAVALSLLVAVPALSQAASYPERPIKLVVPWSAGGDTDTIMRAFASHLNKYLDQPVVVTNVPGASGNVGRKMVANSDPNGYTLLAFHQASIISYLTGVTDINYEKAFEPVCLVSKTPVIVTSAKGTWDTFNEMVEYAKAHPGTVTTGSSFGSTSHLSMLLMEQAADINLKDIPYNGTAARMTAIMGGHVDIVPSNLTQKSKVKAGALNFLAIMTKERSPQVPNVPTMKELGYNVTFGTNRGIMVATGTPEKIVGKLATACRKAKHDPEFIQTLKGMGTTVADAGPEEYAQSLEHQEKLIRQALKSVGLLKRHK